MCIRDSAGDEGDISGDPGSKGAGVARAGPGGRVPAVCPACLLYTSDAADERSSVDLGGRRIIKKKNKSGGRREF